MQMRKCGVELELFLTKDASPISRQDWLEIMARAQEHELELINDPYSGFPIGAVLEQGSFVLDNNVSVLELITQPGDCLEEMKQSLEGLLEFVQKITPEYEMHWTAHFEDESEEAYWERSISSGLYGVVRYLDWPHWKLMNSMAFQPAIDVSPAELPAVLRVIYMTSPLFIYLFEGANNRTGKHAQRLKNWREAIPPAHKRVGLPSREIHSLDDYVENLLDLPPLVLANGAKKDKLTFFDERKAPIRVRDVMFGDVCGHRVTGVPSLERIKTDKITVEDVQIRGDLATFYSLSLPFWHVRLVFHGQCPDQVENKEKIVEAIETSEKLYIELRHLGTPKNMTELEQRYQMFLRLVERAEEINTLISQKMSWQEAIDENSLAIEGAELGPKSQQVYEILKETGVLQEGLQ